VNIGYFAQNQDELLDPDYTVLETIDRVAKGDIRYKMRDILGAFLFSGEDVDKKVKVLSGGEKSRLAMAKLLLEPYNLLVLDEPTNHLDMRSKDILKQALMKLDGTLILVSHDREFLDGMTDKIYEFRDKKIKEHRVGIFEFLQGKQISHLDELNRKIKTVADNQESKSVSDQKQGYLDRKEIDKDIRKTSSQIANIEAEIEATELKIKEIDSKLASGEYIENADFYKDYESLKSNVARLMQQWERLQYELEILQDKRNSVN
jgi:ATP-binding cassette subfamily F protein 3